MLPAKLYATKEETIYSDSNDDEDVWTISDKSGSTGWTTDASSDGYGLPKPLAEALAATPEVIDWLIEHIKYQDGRLKGATELLERGQGIVSRQTKGVISLTDKLEQAQKERDTERDNHMCMRETLRQISVEACDSTRHDDQGAVCSPCHAKSYFENVETGGE